MQVSNIKLLINETKFIMGGGVLEYLWRLKTYLRMRFTIHWQSLISLQKMCKSCGHWWNNSLQRLISRFKCIDCIITEDSQFTNSNCSHSDNHNVTNLCKVSRYKQHWPRLILSVVNSPTELLLYLVPLVSQSDVSFCRSVPGLMTIYLESLYTLQVSQISPRARPRCRYEHEVRADHGLVRSM